MTEAAETDLSKRARYLASAHPAQAAELMAKAEAFDKATIQAFSADATAEDTKRMVGCWARLRRLVCDITGEQPI